MKLIPGDLVKVKLPRATEEEIDKKIFGPLCVAEKPYWRWFQRRVYVIATTPLFDSYDTYLINKEIRVCRLEFVGHMSIEEMLTHDAKAIRKIGIRLQSERR